MVKVKKHVKDNEPDPFYNVYHKRKIPGLDFWDVVGVAITGEKPAKLDYENIKWAVAEGSSLSLIGLIRYDMDNDNFVMTELASLIAGGLEEASSKLKFRMDRMNESVVTATIFGAILLGFGMMFSWSGW